MFDQMALRTLRKRHEIDAYPVQPAIVRVTVAVREACMTIWPGEQLSPRQKECLRWTAQGKSSWDIARILNISENTVNFHVKNAMKKLETSSRTAAAIKAMQLGLIDLPTHARSSKTSSCPIN
jgi:DNA-binding CsgD family transcriptional regulator